MLFFSRFPILLWFVIIALFTSASVSYYTYENVYSKQTEAMRDSELSRINQRIIQLQGTINDTAIIIAVYPLDDSSHKSDSTNENIQSYLFARFDISHVLKALHYRQKQETIQTTLIYFTLLLGGFLLLYFGMQSRIKSIMKGIQCFSDGNYDSRIKLLGNDEFSKISTGFDLMAEKLQSQNQDLASQEQDLRVTLNSIGDAVIATDSDGRIIRMNPVAENLTGWALYEVKGQSITTIFKVVNSETYQPIENPIDKVLKTGRTVHLSNNAVLISRDGTEYNISDSAAPIRNENNDIQGMILIFNDVTEQYRLRQVAAKNERLINAIMDYSPTVIYVKDINGAFTYVNQKYLTIFHTTKEEVIGKTLHDIFPLEIADDMYANDVFVSSTGRILELEEIAPHDDGLHTYNSIKFPLLDASGKVYAVCGISTDITERKQQDELLRRSQKMDALGKLTGGIAHDFNNILGIVMGYGEMLENALSTDPKLRKFAHEIHYAGERGAKLIKKLLSFSRPQQNENEFLNINSLLLDRQEMLQKVLTARIKFELNLESDLWPVWINSGDFEDIIVNISINAMHAMDNAGTLSIQTSNELLDEQDAVYFQIKAGEYVKISFSDTGVGMNKETVDKIFDPFFTSKGELGAGLGLSQVYGFVKSNNGAIKVDSELGNGTCFSIYLPRHMNAEIGEVSNGINAVENLTGKELILVVDDEPSLRSLAEEIFTQNGYGVLTAENGKQALELLDTHAVTVLFSDIIMPEMDGYELAKIVKQNYPNIKIQLVSGYNEDISSELTGELNNKILSKPYNSVDALKCIKHLTQ